MFHLRNCNHYNIKFLILCKYAILFFFNYFRLVFTTPTCYDMFEIYPTDLAICFSLEKIPILKTRDYIHLLR